MAFIYDVMNRLVQKQPDPRRFEPAVSFGYNELGLRTNMVDASGVTTYRYDNRNRLIEKATPQGTLFYAYDANGSVTNIRSSNVNGVALSYGYDELNRLGEVFDPHTGRTSYTYDEVGNLRGFTQPNGVNHFYQYNALNRLTNLNVSAGLSGIANFAYTVGAAGNRLSATESIVRDSINSVATTLNRAYGYDRLYRLTNETIGGTSYASPATLDYSYDKVGNRLSLASTLASIQSVVSSFDLNDRLTTDTYDANGNTTAGRLTPSTAPVVDRYDFENRLADRNNGAAQIVYDGDGNRVRKTVNGVTTLYLVDTVNPTGYAQVLEELTTSNAQLAVVTRVYAYGHALLSQDQFTGSTWTASYYAYDGHGNVRLLTDQNAFVTDTYDYDAFGNLIARTGSTANNYLFTGEQYDSDLGLYYLRARYHNSSTGRFWSMDSFEGFGSDPASLHKYTYCGNNPINCVDPNGFFTNLNEPLQVAVHAPTVRQATYQVVGRIVLYGSLTAVYATGILTSQHALAKAQIDTVALALNVPVLPEEEVMRRQSPGHRYFVHGSSTGSWGTASKISAKSEFADFGPGFYGFDLSPKGFGAAVDRARQKAGQTDGGVGFVLVFRISEADYRGLNELDLYSPYNEILYNMIVARGRRGLGAPANHVVRGPVATRNSSGQYVADGSYPPQYRFDAIGVTKLEPVAVVPTIW